MCITAARARLQDSLLVELIFGDLPARCRRALLRQELSTLDNAAANDFLERVAARVVRGHGLRAQQDLLATHMIDQGEQRRSGNDFDMLAGPRRLA
jgi:hypothetical protein